MNTQERILTTDVGSDTKERLQEIQRALRDAGCAKNDTLPGKLIKKLVFREDALEFLKEEYLSAPRS